MSEFDFIFNHFAKLGKNQQNFLNDGCEIPVPENQKLVVSKDMLISDVHFFRNDPPNSIAQKSLRKNLSDLAAMGTKPYGYFLAISLPQNTNENFISQFCDGLQTVQNQYKIDLLGGDTNSNKNNMIIVSITIFGFTNKNNHLMPRNNAKIGDRIYISGEIGNGYIGYLIHQNKLSMKNNAAKKNFLSHFLYGNCRNDLGEEIADKADSCIDISDGLLQDLMHICKNSNVSGKIYSEKIPLHPEIKSLINTGEINFLDLFKWGDDYELLFCGDDEKLKNIGNIFEIGEIIESPENKSQIYLDEEKVKNCKGFEHL
jgi:thiamine-monophosphate kinase